MTLLLSFVDKERQADSLMERLTGRFAGADEPAQWRDVAFCMAQLPCSERALKKLSEAFKVYAHTLVDDDVAASFEAICAKAKRGAKGGPEAPVRAAADTLEGRIKELRLEEKAEAAPTGEEVRTVRNLHDCP
eukprot:8522396-Pyramimonas_sp.AAC.1